MNLIFVSKLYILLGFHLCINFQNLLTSSENMDFCHHYRKLQNSNGFLCNLFSYEMAQLKVYTFYSHFATKDLVTLLGGFRQQMFDYTAYVVQADGRLVFTV